MAIERMSENIIDIAKPMESAIIQGSLARCPFLFKDPFKPLQFVHFSDVHSMLDPWDRIMTFINHYEVFRLSLIQKHDPLTEKALVEDEVSILYRKTVAELNRNVEGWITTEELAKILCCSSSQLKRTFAKYSNIGIHKYHLKLKTAAAGRMLRQGISPSQIATKLGFASQNYFSTVFKRETGVSPSMYLRHDPDEKEK